MCLYVSGDQKECRPAPAWENLTLSHTIPTFNDPKEEALENTVGKGENAGNQHFSPFTTVFSTLL